MESKREKIAWLVLRIGVAFSFLYATTASFIDPQSWIGWFPSFLRDVINDTALLQIWAIYEIITGIWIISGVKIFWPSLLASFSLIGLILCNFNSMDVIFRDVTILSATIALAIKNAPGKKTAGDKSSA